MFVAIDRGLKKIIKNIIYFEKNVEKYDLYIYKKNGAKPW